MMRSEVQSYILRRLLDHRDENPEGDKISFLVTPHYIQVESPDRPDLIEKIQVEVVECLLFSGKGSRLIQVKYRNRGDTLLISVTGWFPRTVRTIQQIGEDLLL